MKVDLVVSAKGLNNDLSEVLNMEISLFYADEKFISDGTMNIIAQAYFPCLIKD